MKEAEVQKVNAGILQRQGKIRAHRERTETTAIKSQVSAIRSKTQIEKPEPTERELRINRHHRRAMMRAQLRNRLLPIPLLFRHARYGGLSVNVRRVLEKRQPRQGLYLWGVSGDGKSHTACAVARDLVTKAQVVAIKRVRYDDLLKEMRTCYHDGATQTDAEVMSKYRTPDLLILEDVGVTTPIDGQESDFSLTTLYLIIDYRLEHFKPTIITSNKSLDNLTKSFDARIGSRLSTYRVIKLDDKDRRLND